MKVTSVGGRYEYFDMDRTEARALCKWLLTWLEQELPPMGPDTGDESQR